MTKTHKSYKHNNKRNLQYIKGTSGKLYCASFADGKFKLGLCKSQDITNRLRTLRTCVGKNLGFHHQVSVCDVVAAERALFIELDEYRDDKVHEVFTCNVEIIVKAMDKIGLMFPYKGEDDDYENKNDDDDNEDNEKEEQDTAKGDINACIDHQINKYGGIRTCKPCGYSTDKKSSFVNHINSAKHQRLFKKDENCDIDKSVIIERFTDEINQYKEVMKEYKQSIREKDDQIKELIKQKDEQLKVMNMNFAKIHDDDKVDKRSLLNLVKTTINSGRTTDRRINKNIRQSNRDNCDESNSDISDGEYNSDIEMHSESESEPIVRKKKTNIKSNIIKRSLRDIDRQEYHVESIRDTKKRAVKKSNMITKKKTPNVKQIKQDDSEESLDVKSSECEPETPVVKRKKPAVRK